MVKVIFRGRELEFPGSVDEMTPQQYRELLTSVLMLQASEFPPLEVRRALFAMLAGVSAPLRILKDEVLAEIDARLSALDGFFRMTLSGEVLKWQPVCNLMPECEGYKGPGDLLDGVSFGEFVECLTLLEEIPADDHHGAFAVYSRIARILYHIPDDNEVPELLLLHAPAMFGAVWSAIMSGPIEFNGKKIDFRIIFKSSGPGKPDDKTGWSGVTFEVAAAGLFGKVAEVEQTPFWDVLLYLYKCKFEYLNESRKNGSSK